MLFPRASSRGSPPQVVVVVEVGGERLVLVMMVLVLVLVLVLVPVPVLVLVLVLVLRRIFH